MGLEEKNVNSVSLDDTEDALDVGLRLGEDNEIDDEEARVEEEVETTDED